MSTETSPAAVPKARGDRTEGRPASSGAAGGGPDGAAGRLADAGLVIAFLALTFLLGVFPLKDADIYWHLRTGQLIRESGQVPRTDLFTYTRPDAPWIDLHWIFQVGTSRLFERGGAVALNLAKCAITCAAVLLLVTCRRRDWPVWVMLPAWLPALLVLGGRMYVRPETLSLLYLAIFLAVLTRWDRHPALVAILPVVQVAWVNSHGLFVLGPIVLVMALLDAATRPGSLATGPRRWWRIAAVGSLATFAACLVNPYGLRGAVYPIELAGTMKNPVFSLHIAELTPISVFIERAGLGNLPLQLHFLTMGLGAVSFLLPLLWSIGVRFSAATARPAVATDIVPAEPRPPGRRKEKEKADAASKPAKATASSRSRKRKREEAAPEPATTSWRLSPFRLLLFAAFSYLSLQATRNSHQFAAVVGSVTAWNFGEWAAAIRRRRAEKAVGEAAPDAAPATSTLRPRLFAAAAILAVIAWVGSGLFYRMTGEGRTIALGEEPLFFPHEAARFAGRPEMPEKFISFHNAHASLFEYYHGPGRKVYTDPRLEVAGPELFDRYVKLSRSIESKAPGWQAELDGIGRPVVLVDHDLSSANGATLLGDSQWRCVWFDPVAAVFVHESAVEAVRRYGVDFAARHFRPGPSDRPSTPAERVALARACRNYLLVLPSHRADLVRPLVWLGADQCREILRESADAAVGWKLLGQIELAREPAPAQPYSPRYRLPFDPVQDLSLVRATYALRRSLDGNPDDFMTLMSLDLAYERRALHEEAAEVLERLAKIDAINWAAGQRAHKEIETKRAVLRRELGDPPATAWRNRAELDRVIAAMLASGRARGAAELMETASPPERSSWAEIDRLATLRLHLGEPARARELWQHGIGVAPDPAVPSARIGATYLVEGDLDAARRAYRRALEARPDLFEASYSLAVLEQDAGDAAAALEMAQKAVAAAPNDAGRDAARAIAAEVRRFAEKSADAQAGQPTS